MKKYIDADRLKQTIATNVYPVQDAFNRCDYGMFWTGGIEKAIDEQPSADVQEVRHGEWIVAETEYAWNCTEYPASYKCSKCRYIVKAGFEDNYCPHCGAKMDEEALGDSISNIEIG